MSGGAVVWLAGGGTGGHLYPALAIARAVAAADHRAVPFFIGARRGIEREVLPGSGFGFELLDLHPIYRSDPWNNWRTLRGAAGAWRRAAALAAAAPPRALVATGGYAAGIALGYAAAHGIPIAIQEQNSVPGLTVRWFAPRAREIYLGFPEAAGRLRTGRGTRMLVTGNPVSPPPEPRPNPAEARVRWGLDPDPRRPVLLVFGGSQGSVAVNQAVAAWLGTGGAQRSGVQVLWATGRATFERYAGRAGPGVVVTPYISPMQEGYAVATIALSRAGAMTTAELAAWGIPAILVPLPTAAADHQTANARALAAAGAAVLIPPQTLAPAAIDAALMPALHAPGELERMRARMLERARPGAAQVIAGRVLELMGLR